MFQMTELIKNEHFRNLSYSGTFFKWSMLLEMIGFENVLRKLIIFGMA